MNQQRQGKILLLDVLRYMLFTYKKTHISKNHHSIEKYSSAIGFVASKAKRS